MSSVTGTTCDYDSVELAMRVWDNLHVHTLQTPRFTSEQMTIPWLDNTTFQGLVSSHFEKRREFQAMDPSSTDLKLSMALVKEYNFIVSRTSNLADHLKIDLESLLRIMVNEYKYASGITLNGSG